MGKLPSRHKAILDPNALVFPREGGGYLDARHLHDVFARVSQRAGLPTVHPHVLRHTWATLMLKEGTPLTYLSRALGHPSVAFTATVLASADRRV